MKESFLFATSFSLLIQLANFSGGSLMVDGLLQMLHIVIVDNRSCVLAAGYDCWFISFPGCFLWLEKHFLNNERNKYLFMHNY